MPKNNTRLAKRKNNNNNNNNNKNSQKRSNRQRMSQVSILPSAGSRSIMATAPRVTYKNDVTRVIHRECVGVVTAAPGTSTLQWVSMNPTAFPWLKPIAQSYEQYKYRSLSLSYTPSCGSTTSGCVVLFPDMDDKDNDPTDFMQVMAMRGAVRTAAYAPVTCKVPPVALNIAPTRYTREHDEDDSDRWLNIGWFGIWTDLVSVTGPGQVFVDYDVDLYLPQSTRPVIAQSQDRYVVNTTTVTPSDENPTPKNFQMFDNVGFSPISLASDVNYLIAELPTRLAKVQAGISMVNKISQLVSSMGFDMSNAFPSSSSKAKLASALRGSNANLSYFDTTALYTSSQLFADYASIQSTKTLIMTTQIIGPQNDYVSELAVSVHNLSTNITYDFCVGKVSTAGAADDVVTWQFDEQSRCIGVAAGANAPTAVNGFTVIISDVGQLMLPAREVYSIEVSKTRDDSHFPNMKISPWGAYSIMPAYRGISEVTPVADTAFSITYAYGTPETILTGHFERENKATLARLRGVSKNSFPEF